MRDGRIGGGLNVVVSGYDGGRKIEKVPLTGLDGGLNFVGRIDGDGDGGQS